MKVKKVLFPLLLSLAITPVNVLAQEGTDMPDQLTYHSTGNNTGYYEIASTAAYNAFAGYVNAGHQCEGLTFILTSDVDVDCMVEKLFKGTFDGCGHRINVTISSDAASFVAPFATANDATFKNIWTTGTITVTNPESKHASGLIGGSTGNTILRCRVSVDITFPATSTTVYSGGIIGHGGSKLFTMTDCLFDGSMTGGNGNLVNCSGIVGWADSATPNITNCLNAGEFGNNNIAMVLRIGGTHPGTVSNCYSTTNPSGANGGRYDDRGEYTTATGQDLKDLLGDGWTVSGNEVIPIIDRNSMAHVSVSGVETEYEYIFDGTNAISGITLTDYDNNPMTRGTDYTMTLDGTPITGSAFIFGNPGTHTLTFTGIYPYYGTIEKTYTVARYFKPDAQGNYNINDLTDWNMFADSVLAGKTFKNKAVMLKTDLGTAQDPITRKIGSINGTEPDKAFCGNFFGNGHTITVNINDQANYGTALFCNLNSGGISSLNVQGSVVGSEYAAALVGYATGGYNGLVNCVCTATVSGGSCIGGIVGYAKSSNNTIETSVFHGDFLSSSMNRGAIFGWADDGVHVEIIECAYLSASNPSALLDAWNAENGCDIEITGCYGNGPDNHNDLVSINTHGDFYKKQATIRGYDVYVEPCVTMSNKPIVYEQGQTHKPQPKVTLFGNNLVQGTDYALTYSADDDSPAGDYTVTVTGMGDYTGSKQLEYSVLGDQIVQLGGHDFVQKGDGVYLISSIQDLKAVSEYLNGPRNALGYYNNGQSSDGMVFRLADNLDFTGQPLAYDLDADGTPESNFLPIGLGTPFAGTIQGNGKSINGLVLGTGVWQSGTATSRSLGFVYDNTNDAVIRDLTFSNASVTGIVSVGVVAGSNRGTIANCTVTGHTQVNGEVYLGGITGFNCDRGVISRCVVEEDVTVTAAPQGQTLLNDLDVQGCAGGIAGCQLDGIVQGCVSSAAVSIPDNPLFFAAGGIVGRNDESSDNKLTDCLVLNATISGSGNVAAISGMCNANNCYLQRNFYYGCSVITGNGLKSSSNIGAGFVPDNSASSVPAVSIRDCDDYQGAMEAVAVTLDKDMIAYAHGIILPDMDEPLELGCPNYNYNEIPIEPGLPVYMDGTIDVTAFDADDYLREYVAGNPCLVPVFYYGTVYKNVGYMDRGGYFEVSYCGQVPVGKKFYGFYESSPDDMDEPYSITEYCHNDMYKTYEIYTSICDKTVIPIIEREDLFGKLSGNDGSDEHPYTIGSLFELFAFCDSVDNGNKPVSCKLIADISNCFFTIGRDEFDPYRGTFDGNGYSIDFQFYGDEPGIAPFSYVTNATIKNLRVTGTLLASQATCIYASGLVGIGTNVVISNCRVSTGLIYIDEVKSAFGGGIIGNAGLSVRIVDCLFDGSLTGPGNTGNLAGLVGWCVSDDLNITNCLNAGTFCNQDNIAKIARADGNGSITNCYSTVDANCDGIFPDDRGEYTTQSGQALKELLGSNWTVQGYDVVPIMSAVNMNSSNVSGIDVIYAYTGMPIELDYTVTDPAGNILSADTDFEALLTFNGRAVSSVSNPGSYTLTLTGLDPYCGSITRTFNVVEGYTALQTDASGAYMISSTADWNTFAMAVASGVDFKGVTLKLCQDISVNRGVGVVDGDKPLKAFSGTFDGQGHTVTADISDTENLYTALFRYIDNGNIHDLNVAGAVNGGKYAASVVGYIRGESSILSSCKSAATVTGQEYIGGLVGLTENSTAFIEKCVFKGLLSSADACLGAFVGYVGLYGIASLSKCLYILQDGQKTGKLDLLNESRDCYALMTECYKNTETIKRGTFVYTDAESLAGYMYGTDVLNGETIYVPARIMIPTSNYKYEAGVTHKPEPVVVFNGQDLTKDVDYTVSWSDADDSPEGQYTVTVLANGQYGGSRSISYSVVDAEMVDLGGHLFISPEQNVYLICDAQDLMALANYANENIDIFDTGQSAGGNDCEGMVFKLANDIDLRDVPFMYDLDGDGVLESNMIPIGLNGFAGGFEGNGKTISGITMKYEIDMFFFMMMSYDPGMCACQGLFGNLQENAWVADLTLCDMSLEGLYGIGGICCINLGYIYDCRVTGNTTIRGSERIGGIAGMNMGTIFRSKVDKTVDICMNKGIMSMRPGELFGGIVGLNTCGKMTGGLVIGCVSSARMDSEPSKSVVGGICGGNEEGVIKDCLVFDTELSGYGGVGAILGGGDSYGCLLRNYYSNVTVKIDYEYSKDSDIGVGYDYYSEDLDVENGAMQAFPVKLPDNFTAYAYAASIPSLYTDIMAFCDAPINKNLPLAAPVRGGKTMSQPVTNNYWGLPMLEGVTPIFSEFSGDEDALNGVIYNGNEYLFIPVYGDGTIYDKTAYMLPHSAIRMGYGGALVDEMFYGYKVIGEVWGDTLITSLNVIKDFNLVEVDFEDNYLMLEPVFGPEDAWGYMSGSDGSSEHPFTISSPIEYYLISDKLADRDGFYGICFKLTDDIKLDGFYYSLGLMRDEPFCGTFDGDGHTMELDMKFPDSMDPYLVGMPLYLAPFNSIFDASIKNLNVTGSVKGNIYSSGLVGNVVGGENLIENCTVSVDIADPCSGGIIGYMSNCGVTVKDCVFSGSMDESSEGGTIAGFCESASELTMTNCLDLSNNSLPMSYGDNVPTGSNNYYTGWNKEAGWMTSAENYALHGYEIPGLSDSLTLHSDIGIAYDGKIYVAHGQNIDVTYNRTFRKNVASTVCLPFNISSEQAANAGTFYEFVGVDESVPEWEVVMQETNVTTDNPLQANKPYMFIPKETATLNLVGTIEYDWFDFGAGSAMTDKWRFAGTYERIDWETDPMTIYGFAAAGAGSPVEAGTFFRVKGGKNSYILPFRAYITYGKKIPLPPFAMPIDSVIVIPMPSPMRGDVADPGVTSLPETMKLRLLSADGNTTAVGTIDMQTGNMTIDKWYDMRGNELPGKPTDEGIYIYNGKKYKF